MIGTWWQWLKLTKDRKAERPRSFVSEVEWHRNEELRPDRLGPSQDDVKDAEPVRDPWRPVRSLGPMRRS